MQFSIPESKNRLPSFFCVGTQKSGTTSLHDILNQDENIFLPYCKETRFFFDDDLYNKGIEFYKNEFFSPNYHQIVGEINPDYMYFETVPKRLFKHFGTDLKLIFIMRNPIERALSHYLMTKKMGHETENFETALSLEPERLRNKTLRRGFYSYLDRGYYSEQIKRYLEFFPIENMLFFVFEEDFINNRENTIRTIYKFLGLPYNDKLNLNVHSHKRKHSRFNFLSRLLYDKKECAALKRFYRAFTPKKIRKGLKELLFRFNHSDSVDIDVTKSTLKKLNNKFFSDEIKTLESLIGRSLKCWH